MELRIIILSVACFSCLVPSALSTGIIASAAAVKGAALLGAGALAAKGAILGKGALLAKGLVGAKLAAMTAAKVAALKGAALLASGSAAQGIALGGAALHAKANVVAALSSPPHPHHPPVLAERVIAEPVPHPTLFRAVEVHDLPLPSIKDKASAVVGIAKSFVDFKSSIISRLLGHVKAHIDAIPPPQPIVYEVLSPPARRIYPRPPRPFFEVLEIDDKKKK